MAGVTNTVQTYASIANLNYAGVGTGTSTVNTSYFNISNSDLGNVTDLSLNKLTVANRLVTTAEASTELSGPTAVFNQTQSTSTTSGALTVSGGVGVSKNINSGGNITATGSVQSAGVTSSGDVVISSSTAAGNSTQGALRVAGGVGVGGDLHVNGAIFSSVGFGGTVDSISLSNKLVVPRIESATNLTLAPSSHTTTDKPIIVTDTTASSSSSTGAIRVSGGVGVGGSLNVGGNVSAAQLGCTSLSSSGNVTVTSNTASSNTTTGALQVTGGVGIGQNLNVGGSTSITGTLNGSTAILSLSLTTPTVESTSDLNLAPATKTLTSKPISITDTTASSSSSTGALTVSGGIGLAGDLRSGGTLYGSSSSLSTSVVTPLISNPAGSITLTPDTTTTTAKPVTITNATGSSSTSTGALTVGGGLGVVGNVNIGGSVNASQSTLATKLVTPLIETSSGNLTLAPASSTTTAKPFIITDTTQGSATTGALTVNGGARIGGNLYVAGSVLATDGTGGSSTAWSLSSKLITPLIEAPDTLTLTPASTTTTAKPVAITNNTASTSSSTGALTVSGGLGVGGKTYFGSDINLGSGALVRGTHSIFPIQLSKSVPWQGNNQSLNNYTDVNLSEFTGLVPGFAWLAIQEADQVRGSGTEGYSGSSSDAFGYALCLVHLYPAYQASGDLMTFGTSRIDLLWTVLERGGISLSFGSYSTNNASTGNTSFRITNSRTSATATDRLFSISLQYVGGPQYLQPGATIASSSSIEQPQVFSLKTRQEDLHPRRAAKRVKIIPV